MSKLSEKKSKFILIYDLTFCILALAAVYLSLCDLTTGYTSFQIKIDNIITIIFIVDYVVRLSLAKNKKDFFRQNILDLIAIIPFTSLFKIFRVLKVFKITPYGYHHDPKSDAKNLMLLYDALLKNKSILKKEYIKVLLKNPHLQGPIRKALIKIIKDKNCTNVDFYNFVEEEIK